LFLSGPLEKNKKSELSSTNITKTRKRGEGRNGPNTKKRGTKGDVPGGGDFKSGGKIRGSARLRGGNHDGGPFVKTGNAKKNDKGKKS